MDIQEAEMESQWGQCTVLWATVYSSTGSVLLCSDVMYGRQGKRTLDHSVNLFVSDASMVSSFSHA